MASLQERLEQAWRDVLGPDVRLDQDFFVAGGDSLKATKLAARLRRRGLTVNLADLLEHRTVAAQLALLDANGAGVDEAAADPVLGNGHMRAATVPSYNQLNRIRLVRNRMLDGGGHIPHVVQITVELTGALDERALDAAVRDVAQRHPLLHIAYLTDEYEVIVEERPLPPGWGVEVHDLSGYDAETAERRSAEIISRQVEQSPPLHRPPLWSVLLNRFTPDRAVLSISLDHLIADEVSVVVIWADLCAYYEARVAGRPADLPPLAVRAQDLLATREELRSKREPVLMQRWDEELAGYPNAPAADLYDADLYQDFTPPAPTTYRTIRIDGATASAFVERCLEERVTEHTALLGALHYAIHVTSGRSDVVVVSARAFRETPEEELLVGWLSDMVMVRLGRDLPQPPCLTPVSDLARLAGRRFAFGLRNAVPFHRLVQRYQGTVSGRSPRRPYIYYNLDRVSLVTRDLGPVAARQVEPLPTPLTTFAGPGILATCDREGIVVTLSTVRDRYPEALLARFDAALVDAVEAFVAGSGRAVCTGACRCGA